MNRAMTIIIDTHPDDFNIYRAKIVVATYCRRFIPLFAGALHACAGQASDHFNQIINT